MLESAKAGDPAAVARLFDRFGADVNRVIWKVLGADSEHDDLVHDAFVRVLAHIRSVRDADSLGSWVVSVALRTAYKELRRRRVRRFWGGDVRTAPELTFPEADHEARDLLRHTQAIMRRMPAKEQLVLSLRAWDDRSIEQIASLSGWSVSTVKRTLRRATVRFESLAASEPAMAGRLCEARRKGES